MLNLTKALATICLQSRLISVLPMPMRPNENKMSDRASYNGVHKQ